MNSFNQSKIAMISNSNRSLFPLIANIEDKNNDVLLKAFLTL
jgi:hypothetical protein